MGLLYPLGSKLDSSGCSQQRTKHRSSRTKHGECPLSSPAFVCSLTTTLCEDLRFLQHRDPIATSETPDPPSGWGILLMATP